MSGDRRLQIIALAAKRSVFMMGSPFAARLETLAARARPSNSRDRRHHHRLLPTVSRRRQPEWNPHDPKVTEPEG